MADSENTQVISLCNYCGRKVIKKVECTNCGATFHGSCSARKVCCSKQVFIQEKSQENLSTKCEDESTTEIIIESLKWENKLLMELNKELKDSNLLLKNKIHSLEKQLDTCNTPGVPIQQTFLTKSIEESLKSFLSKELNDFFTQNPIDQVSKHSASVINDSNCGKNHTISEQKNPQMISTNLTAKNTKTSINLNSNLTTLENTQRNLMQEIINIEKDTSPQKTIKGHNEKLRVNSAPSVPSRAGTINPNNASSSNEGFIYPKYNKKRIIKNSNVGKGAPLGNFQGLKKTDKEEKKFGSFYHM